MSSGEHTVTVTRPPGQSDGQAPKVRLPGRWKLDRILGRGGQAEVWLACDQQLNESVAVKIFNPDLTPTAVERLRVEVKLGRTLQHSNLVRVYELIEAGEGLAMAMEWLPGGSVAKRLDSGPMPIDEVIAIGDQTLAALEYLHGKHIIHRDVKPSNLLFDAKGQVHLADLGLVRVLDEEGMTRTTTAIGTPHYMSPEQLRNHKLSAASDLYSLGVTMFQLITGHAPFEAASEFDLARKHLEAKAPDPCAIRADCPKWLARFVLRLLEKSPTDRWPDAAAARLEFHGQQPRISPRLIRRRWLVAAGSVVTAIVALMVWKPIANAIKSKQDVKIHTSGNKLTAVNAFDKEVLSLTLDSPIQQTIRTDLDGDRRLMTAVVAYPKTTERATSMAESEVVLIDAQGKVIYHLRPEFLIRSWPQGFRKLLNPRIHSLDLNGDGHLELLLICYGRDPAYTAMIVYWRELDIWDVVLLHSGYINEVIPVPRSSPPKLRIQAYNNNFGMVHILGEMELLPISMASRSAFARLLQSPDADPIGEAEASRWVWYSLLDQIRDTGGGLSPLVLAPDGTMSFTFGRKPMSIDRFGNPVPGPNEGRDLVGLRKWFYSNSLDLLDPTKQRGKAEMLAIIENIRNRSHSLLEEKSYKAALAIDTSLALVRIDDSDSAKTILREAYNEIGYEDISHRLANLEAIAGRLDEAISITSEICRTGLTPSGNYRGRRLLLHLAAEKHDPQLVQKMLSYVVPTWVVPDSEGIGVRAAFLAHVDLWWDRCQSIDGQVRSWDYQPEGEAVAGVARWRMGIMTAVDEEILINCERNSPEAVYGCRIARALAVQTAGRADEALLSLSETIQALTPLAREDFSSLQWLQLARAINAHMLLKSGRIAEARREAETLKTHLRPGLLPAILVDEVLIKTSRR